MGLYTKIIDLQKLGWAWEKVRQKKAAPGIDNMTTEVFAAYQTQELKQLNLELKEQRYEPQPVRMILLRKDEKEREVSLFCLRDKIVQQSIAGELHKMYDSSFARESFAFHSRRSALEAVSSIEKRVCGQPDMWVLKTDIRHFFDEISHKELLEILKERIQETEVINLIQLFLKVPALDENGELKSKERGIYQGSTIAPLLSNIYLNEFDHRIREKTAFYYRYADDILCMDQDREKIDVVMAEMQQELGNLQLELHEKKTKICQVKQGFSYLGYEFSADGKIIPAKKQTALKERLEEMWFQQMEFEQKIQKGLEITNGWKQYFSGKQQAQSIYELVLEVWCQKEKGKGLFQSFVQTETKMTAYSANETLIERLWQQRRRFTNMHADICNFFAQLWTSWGKEEAVLFEYEQLWQIEHLDRERCVGENSDADVKVLLQCYRNLQVSLKKEDLENIMQLYMDLRCYNKAAVFDGKIKELERCRHLEMCLSDQEISGKNDRAVEKKDEKLGGKMSENSCSLDRENLDFSLNDSERELFHQLFAGREDIYAQETVNAYGKRTYELMNEPLTLELLTDMLQKQISLATYVQRNNGTVHFMVFDLDISKKVLLKYAPETEEFSRYLEQTKEMAYLLKKVLLQMGLSSTVEFSGFRGYHIWIFFQEWINVRYIHMLQDAIMKKLEQEQEKIPELWQLKNRQEIIIESFPNHTRVNKDRAGQCIRIPFSRHIRTNRRTCFLDETGNPYSRQAEVLQQAVQYPLSTVKRIIALSDSSGAGSENQKHCQQTDDKDDIQILYPDLKPTVKIVLEKCNLMRYLCKKAKTTGYLTHFERQTIMYVFAHLGDDGKAFVHQVMEQTLNYRFATTERFIQKLPAKPISCVKLREQYSQITAEIGCSCKFRRTKNCYPSPVLHAVKDNQEIQQDITLPLSRDVSQIKEKQIYEEINIHRKAQELAEKLLEYKKQKRGIDKNVRKLEDELTEIFNNAAVDCMEIEMGLLSRRRKEERYEWVIEL